MSWHLHVQSAEAMLNDASIPSSLEIITLIKKVNPTKLCLSETDRERGYEIKGKLQNLLLENYGEVFHLAPHPCSDKYVLIKHTALPSIDACHAEVSSLSPKALDTVADGSVKPREKKPKHRKGSDASHAEAGCSPRASLQKAQALLEEYDYAGAEEVLAAIRVATADEAATIERAARVLVEEMGAYERAIETLLAQPKRLLRDKGLRELLALTYYHNGNLPEARAIFESLHPDDLAKPALCAWADISFRDDNPQLAFDLLTVANGKEGFVATLSGLQKEIEARMLADAEPLMRRALAALEAGDLPAATAWARQALLHCPNHPRARQIVGAMDASREAAEIASLWERLAAAEKGEARLELLARLQERDPGQDERIGRLIAAEKARLRKDLVDSRLDELRRLSGEGRWRECYDILLWLSRQEDLAEQYRAACSLSPYFRVLYQNRALQKLSERTAKENWLQFVEAKSLLGCGRRDDCLEMMEGIKAYFQQYPEFADDHLALLRLEQQRAREEVVDLLSQLGAEGVPLSHGERIAASIRRKMAVLPDQERLEHLATVEARLADLRPVQTEESLLNQYKKALLLGFTDKAALLREQISDKVAIARHDARVAGYFRIESQPLSLTITKDTSKAKLLAKPNLNWCWQSDRHIVFEDRDGWVVINFEESSATRFIFPHFLKKPIFVDSLPKSNTFLVRDLATGLVWRAELAAGKGAFTAVFSWRDFSPDDNYIPVVICASSERATDYYVLLYDDRTPRPGKAVRTRLTGKKTFFDVLQMADKGPPYMRRLGSEPDRFIVGWADKLMICNKNLTWETSLKVTPHIWEIDEANQQFYYFCNHVLEKADFRYQHSEKFDRAQYCYFFNLHHRVLGLCPESDIVMVGTGERAAFYDLRAHRMSETFRFRRVVCTRPARSWYCFDYDIKRQQLTLVDITGELQTLLRWDECADLLEGEDQERDRRFEESTGQIFLGYQPGQKLPGGKRARPRKQNHKEVERRASIEGRCRFDKEGAAKEELFRCVPPLVVRGRRFRDATLRHKRRNADEERQRRRRVAGRRRRFR